MIPNSCAHPVLRLLFRMSLHVGVVGIAVCFRARLTTTGVIGVPTNRPVAGITVTRLHLYPPLASAIEQEPDGLRDGAAVLSCVPFKGAFHCWCHTDDQLLRQCRSTHVFTVQPPSAR